MAKLLRRQNKITEAEQAPPEAAEENKTDQEQDKSSQKPPPPPQRKTPSLNTQPSSQATPPQPTTVPPPEPAEIGTAAFKPLKPKPLPQKLKEVEPEMTPWQLELAARRARLAEHEPDPVVEAIEGDQAHDKEPSPTPIPRQQQPLPAPKPKRKLPPPQAAKARSPSPSPATSIPPQEQVLPVKKTSVPSPEIALSGPAKESYTHTVRPCSGEAERATLPVEVSTLAASSNDQCESWSPVLCC